MGKNNDVSIEQLKLAIKGADTGIFELNLQNLTFYWSERLYELIRYSPNELNASLVTFFSILHPDFHHLLFKVKLKEYRDGKRRSFNVKILCGNKEYRWFNISFVPEVIDNMVTRIGGTFSDIHDTYQIEQQLAELNNDFLSVLNSIHGTYFKYNFSTQLFSTNADYASELGLDESNKNLHLDTLKQLIHPEDFNALLTVLERVNKPRLAELRFGTKEKGYKWFLMQANPRLRSDGDVPELFGILYNHQRLKSVEIEKDLLIKILQRSNDKINNFNYVATHNLRANATYLISLSELLNDSGEQMFEPEKVRDYIKTTSNKILEIIDELYFESSRYLGNDPKNFKKVLLHRVINLILQEPEFKENPITVQKKLLVSSLFTNEKILRVILKELFINAHQFRRNCADDTISIEMYKKGENIELLFHDNGIGFDSNKYKDRLFGLYQTFHSSNVVQRTRKGKGLYKVKNLVHEIGGDIYLTSEEGKGTTITISLPQ